MKYVILVGGMAGFFTAFLTDIYFERNPQRMFFDSATGCLAGALLVRWFWGILIIGIRDTQVATYKKKLAAAEEAKRKAREKSAT
jgi:hypothetical protein